MKTKVNAKERAQEIKDMAVKLGWAVMVRGGVLTIMKNFTAGSREEFVQADGEYYSILSLLPMTSPGSTWGTDGGGVGSMSAIKHGVMKMNKSGGNKRILKALQEIT